MKLVPIFVDQHFEGLYAVHFDGSTSDEFEKNLDNWRDTNFVMSYFIFNQEYLKDDYFSNYTIDDLIDKVLDECLRLKDDFESSDANLESLFKPLNPGTKKFDSTILQVAKSMVIDKQNYPQPILRFYGLRISNKTFIITGGAIKLCHSMKDHPDTKKELEKISEIRQWLADNDVTTQDDINYCYGEEE